jgi:hypothetical protein
VKQQRKWLGDQFKAYNAQREAAGKHMGDPGYWFDVNMPGVDPLFAHYFTIMGQLQQQMSAPMNIFRNLGIFKAINPHTIEATDLPQYNLERLTVARTRFSRQLDDANKAIAQKFGVTPTVPDESAPSAAAAPPLRTRPPVPKGRLSDDDLHNGVKDLTGG